MNWAEIVQLAPAATEVPQVVETKEKSVPVTALAVGTVTDSGPTPVLVSVAVPVFEPPTAVAGKLIPVNDAACAVPVPETASAAEVEGAAADAVTLPE